MHTILRAAVAGLLLLLWPLPSAADPLAWEDAVDLSVRAAVRAGEDTTALLVARGALERAQQAVQEAEQRAQLAEYLATLARKAAQALAPPSSLQPMPLQPQQPLHTP